jgi:general secretion pathway protein G
MCLTLACYNRPESHPDRGLRDDLAVMRRAIDDYFAKHHSYPHSLSDLVRDGELRTIPVDPITGSPATWRVMKRETVSVDDFTSRAAAPESSEIVDVHSGAPGNDPGGHPWSSY